MYHTQNVITDISILFITNFVCVEMYVLSNKMNLYWTVTQMKLIPLTKLSSTNSPLQKTYRVMVWTRYGVFSQVLNPVRPSISVQGHFHSCQYNQIYQNSLEIWISLLNKDTSTWTIPQNQHRIIEMVNLLNITDLYFLD